jgi:hypothetical protein
MFPQSEIVINDIYEARKILDDGATGKPLLTLTTKRLIHNLSLFKKGLYMEKSCTILFDTALCAFYNAVQYVWMW